MAPGTPVNLGIQGLFTEPRERAVDEEIVIDGETQFPPWTPGMAVIYDLAGGRLFELGAGTVPVFSSDGARAAYLAGEDALNTGGQLTVVSLADGSKDVLGTTGNVVRWLDRDALLVRETTMSG